MIFLGKSELPFSKCPTKNYITPSPKYMSNPLKRRTLITHPTHPPPPHLYPNHHAPDVFRSFQFPLLKKLTMRNCVDLLVKLNNIINDIEYRP